MVTGIVFRANSALRLLVPTLLKFERSSTTMATSPLDQLTDVDIDIGVYKYILIKVHHETNGKEMHKYIVRGCSSAEYHGDIYDQVAPAIESKKMDCECVGGGRIRHEPDKKSILVYGYSQGYGKADHGITVELLKKKYSDYASITYSNDGY